MIALDPADYRRRPWKNGAGVSELIAEGAEPAREGDGRPPSWSLSRTTFAVASPFSDLSGYDRLQLLAAGRGLRLRALDGGPDLALAPGEVGCFDGGRRFEGIPDGAVEVVNLMGRTGRVALAMALAGPHEGQQRFAAQVVLMHAPFGPVVLRAGPTVHELGEGWTLRADHTELAIEVLAGRALIATVRPAGG